MKYLKTSLRLYPRQTFSSSTGKKTTSKHSSVEKWITYQLATSYRQQKVNQRELPFDGMTKSEF
jgi:hypothetical protein